MEIVIVSGSYRFGLIGNIIVFYSYRSERMIKGIAFNAVMFRSNVADLCLQILHINILYSTSTGTVRILLNCKIKII
jgi:hypothetical protein